MEINKEILKSWSILYERGDKQELARLTKKSYPTILKAFNGHADYDLVESINQFYKQRKERNKSIQTI